ncbi:MAG: lysophospholipid acyltransferase family protein [Verrucomicrobiota bacterium]
MSRRFLSVLHAEITITGTVPFHGLIACNHLAYVDILVLGSICPAIFVAKSDVVTWPVFGWLASRAGTIFVSRDAPAKVAAQLREIEQPLREGRPVILFPEGTSSDGSQILPFRSSLLESAIITGAPVTPVAIGYDLQGEGDVETEVAYWGDLVLLPHLINLLSKTSFHARLSFGQTRPPLPDRKQETRLLQEEVRLLHSSLVGSAGLTERANRSCEESFSHI